ncbi:MAG: putative ABC transporter ATP-binding protein [bacterium ADurb.Bin212]|nr:MAG: putative ABC transporter ATP-binding protein [bacterium ADurb.Bin212]
MEREHYIVVEARNVTKQYSSVSESMALKEVTLKIRSGEFIILFGPSGCGKSTLLNIIYGLERPTKGEVYLREKKLFEMSERELDEVHRYKIGYVFQQFSFLRNLNVLDNVCLPKMFIGEPFNSRRKRAMQLLEELHLDQFSRRYPQELSGGQQQRVALARSQINNPRIMFFDEPTGNLDKKTGLHVMNMIRKMNRHSKKTVVMVTHDPSYLDYAHRVIYMQDGQIIKEKNNHRLMFLTAPKESK